MCHISVVRFLVFDVVVVVVFVVDVQDKLERADKLVGGLAGEFVRWQASIGTYEAMIERLVGDSLIAAAFLSYAGTFDTIYRYAYVHLTVCNKDAAKKNRRFSPLQFSLVIPA